MIKYTYAALLFIFFTYNLQAQIDRSVIPEPGPPPEIHLGQPQSFELKSGLKVLIVTDHKLPRVSMQLTLDNSPVLEGDKAGVGALVASLLGNGSKNISKDAFNEEVDFLGASIHFGAQSASAQTLSKYFPRILELLADAAINPNFTQEDFDTEKARLLTSLKSQEKDVSAIAERLQDALAYGREHPYGEFITPETLNRVTLQDVINFYRDYFVPANAYLVIVGDVDYEQAQELVTDYFTPWTYAVPPSFTYSDPPGAPYTQIDFVDMPNAVQSEIAVEHLVNLKMKDPDYMPALLANRIFGGGAQGRIERNIREDKGFAYYAYSTLGNDKYAPATFKAITSVRNAVTDSTVVELISELDSIALPTITEDELNNVKAEYTGAFVLALEKPQTIARYALNIETEDLSKDFYTSYLERLNAVSLEQVQEAASKYISSRNARIVIAGKGIEVLPGLEKISYKGHPIPVLFYNKLGEQVDKPDYQGSLPEGTTLQTVINAYFNAIGGQDAVNGVETLRLVYEGTTMGTAFKVVELRTDDRYAQTTYLDNDPVMGVIAKGTEFFMKQQGARMPLPPGMQQDLEKSMGVFPEKRVLANPDARLVGIEKVDGQDAYRIDVPGEMVQASYFYDVESGLKLKETSTVSINGQTHTQEVFFRDYEDKGGLRFPGVRIGSMGGQMVESKLTGAEVNGAISDSDFE